MSGRRVIHSDNIHFKTIFGKAVETHEFADSLQFAIELIKYNNEAITYMLNLRKKNMHCRADFVDIVEELNSSKAKV